MAAVRQSPRRADDGQSSPGTRSIAGSCAVLAALAGPSGVADGKPGLELMIQHPYGEFALFVGELPSQPGPGAGLFGKTVPFEVWVNGAEQPRGLGRSPRRCRWTCAPTTAMAQAQARCTRHRG